MFEVKVVNAFAEIYPQIFFIEDGKISSGALQQGVAVIVESSRMNFPAEEFAHTVTHLAGGGHGVGEGKNFLRLRVALLGETRDALNQDRSFSGTGPGNHQHWTVNVLDGFALAIVGEEWSGRRLKFGDSHWGSEYHQVQNGAEAQSVENQSEDMAETTTATAAIAAVSARRIVLPSEAGVHPAC